MFHQVPHEADLAGLVAEQVNDRDPSIGIAWSAMLQLDFEKTKLENVVEVLNGVRLDGVAMVDNPRVNDELCHRLSAGIFNTHSLQKGVPLIELLMPSFGPANQSHLDARVICGLNQHIIQLGLPVEDLAGQFEEI